MNHNRRAFLRWGGSLAAGLALAPAACKLMSKDEKKAAEDEAAKKGASPAEAGAALTTFGLQLYTLRDDFPKDPKGVLKQVSEMGYKQLESFEFDKGIFWGMTPAEWKNYTDDLGMTTISSHCEITKNFEKKAADAASIGMKYLICPWKGPQKTLDDYKKLGDEFNKAGEICRKNGIRFAYHNHAYTFTAVDGQMPQDIVMSNSDPALVDFEMDMYWVVTANQDPEAWLKKYKDRFRLCHVKDRTKNATAESDSCTLGEGSIDYARILKTAKENGMQYFIVEQEKYEGTTPLKAAADDAAYMKKLVI